jgi:prophage regulatory protein
MNSTTALPNSNLQVLRLPQVIQITGLCRSMIYQLEAADRFPRRIRIGARAVGWLHGEVQQWLADRVMQSRRPPASALCRALTG